VFSISHQARRAFPACSAFFLRYNGAAVEWTIIALNFVYATLGVVLMFLSYRMIDRLTPEVDFPSELRKGNVAVAIVIASIFIAIAIIVGGALN
jgi:putative membrane protein